MPNTPGEGGGGGTDKPTPTSPEPKEMTQEQKDAARQKELEHNDAVYERIVKNIEKSIFGNVPIFITFVCACNHFSNFFCCHFFL